MAKYIITNKHKELSDDEIEKFKNFKTIKSAYAEELRAAYKKKLYDRRNKKIFLAIFLFAIIIWLVFIN